MFKKGQLVRSTRTGELFVVVFGYYYSTYVLTINNFLDAEARPWHMLKLIQLEDNGTLTLIGNNYQAEPKCSR